MVHQMESKWLRIPSCSTGPLNLIISSQSLLNKGILWLPSTLREVLHLAKVRVYFLRTIALNRSSNL